MAKSLVQTEVDYPDSDGEPLAETFLHVLVMTYLFTVLNNYFRNRQDVFVGANQFLYYKEGHPRRRVAPDVYVVFGIEKKPRRSYKLWEEGQAPQVIIELTSLSTKKEDLVFKKSLYERLGVEEYFLVDVLGEYLLQPLQGYRLVEGIYQPMLVVRDGDHWRAHSEVLGLDIVLEWDDDYYRVRLFDPAKQEWLLSMEEASQQLEETSQQLEETSQQLEETSQQLEQERQARLLLEQRLKALEEELNRQEEGESVAN